MTSTRRRGSVGRTALFAAALLAAGCASARQQPGSSAADEEAAIRELRGAQNRAIRERDLDAITEVMEEGIQVTSGIGIHVTGRDAYRRAFETEFRALDDIVYVRRPSEVVVSDVPTGLAESIAWESGEWTGSWTGPEGLVSMTGSYAAMWRKRDGRWRINTELFASLSCEGEGCPE